MQTLNVTVEDFTPEVSSLYVTAGGAIALETPGVAGAYPLVRLPASVRMTGIESLVFQGTGLSHVFLFPVIDGVPSYRSASGLWVGLGYLVKPAEYPTLGIPLNAVTAEVLQTIFTDGGHLFGIALAFDGSQAISPEVSGFALGYHNSPVSGAVDFTRVYGSFPVQHGFAAPSSFQVRLNKPAIGYKDQVLTMSPITVEVNTDGTWEVWLPDTESMDDPLAAYFFDFVPARPLARKVPKAIELPWSTLGVLYSA